jgi:hypothetical protein
MLLSLKFKAEKGIFWHTTITAKQDVSSINLTNKESKKCKQ